MPHGPSARAEYFGPPLSAARADRISPGLRRVSLASEAGGLADLVGVSVVKWSHVAVAESVVWSRPTKGMPVFVLQYTNEYIPFSGTTPGLLAWHAQAMPPCSAPRTCAPSRTCSRLRAQKSGKVACPSSAPQSQHAQNGPNLCGRVPDRAHTAGVPIPRRRVRHCRVHALVRLMQRPGKPRDRAGTRFGRLYSQELGQRVGRRHEHEERAHRVGNARKGDLRVCRGRAAAALPAGQGG
eukprot:167128-Chlamydomonas_euryale.AAC.1